ncbi:MAG: transporter [Proteobacteria bacterium]|nr:MAG: transporter [Pseudomonadota bacterium]
MHDQSHDPLHGVTLEKMLIRLHDHFGWEELGNRIRIRCFQHDPSVKSSLKFLRKTPWARSKVEALYTKMVKSPWYTPPEAPDP